MSSNYNTYLNYLASFADSHVLAVQTETNVYPLFSDIKRLISHYKSTIQKYATVQDELVSFVEGLKYDEGDFDYYQDKFKSLRTTDEYLQELKTKNIPSSLSNEVQNFISETYASTSLYDMNNLEEKVLFYHNKVAEGKRQEASQAQTTKTIIIIVCVVLLIIFLISKCNN